MRHRHLLLLLQSLCVVCLAAVSAVAQCPTPDGLAGGPCCTTVTPDLPDFPNFEQDSLNICWRNCDVEAFFGCTARWQIRPRADACGVYQLRVRLGNAANQSKWVGTLTGTYSRTWLEVSAAGSELQVWRLLVNGDLRPTPNAGTVPCPVPPCAQAHKRNVRFTGYIDFAQDCSSGAFSNAWMLTHSCDVVDHAPGFPRAGSFHPDRAYTFVGPAAGFAIGPIQVVASGGTSSESVRRIRRAAGAPVQCEYEEQVDAGLEPVQELCICGFPTAPGQYVISDLGLGSSCGTSIFTPGGPYLPGYVSMGIGTWTDPFRYPGLEVLRWSAGGYDYFDPCAGVTRQEVFFGVTTIRGYEAINIESGVPLPLSFVDQVNSLRQGGTTMNVPFESDHVINLNFP